MNNIYKKNYNLLYLTFVVVYGELIQKVTYILFLVIFVQ